MRLAGFTAIDGLLVSWISGSAGAPQGQRACCAPQVVVRMLLTELGKDAGSPMAVAVRSVAGFAPHLGQVPLTGVAQAEQDEARQAIEEARSLLGELREGLDDPLAALFDLLSQASRSALFAPGEGGEIALATPRGSVVTRLPGHVGHHWALGMLAGETLWRKGYMSAPAPIIAILSAEMLRPDLGRQERMSAYYRQARAAFAGVLADIERARQWAGAARTALGERRSSSRSAAVHAAIAGLGGLKRSQILQGLGLSPRGVDIVLEPLKTAGLIEQERRGAPFTASRPDRSWRANGDGGTPSHAHYAELDGAMADLDRLLQRAGE